MLEAGISHQGVSPSRFRSDIALLLYIAGFKLFIHLAINLFGGYGYFRDELYYLACSDHMAWGYVDHPPLSIAVLWVSRLLFGDSLFSLRLLPAISGAVVVVLTGLITREIGGNRYAQVLAAVCVVAAPLPLGMDSIFSMNSFDILFWTLALYLVTLIINRDGTTTWLLLALTLGLGLLNKISVLWLITALVAGFLLTSNRRLLLSRGGLIAALLTLLIFLPHLIWQIVNGYPTLEFIRNAASGKYAPLSPFELLVQQALFMNPLTSPFWITGVIYVLISKTSKRFRMLSIIYLAVFLILSVGKNVKAAYLVPLMPLLFVLGAFAAEKAIRKINWIWLKPVALVVIPISGVFLAPTVLGVLPVETYVVYARTLGVAPPASESHTLGSLPQHFADRFGWPEMVAAVAEAYDKLSPAEKSKCAILCNNYGEAGAIDFFGRNHDLPGALSGHNNYWLWGIGNDAGEVVIRVGGKESDLKVSYAEVIKSGIFKNDYCMPYESNLPIWICKNRRIPLKDDWIQFKVFN
jgi:nitrate reductase NapE component